MACAMERSDSLDGKTKSRNGSGMELDSLPKQITPLLPHMDMVKWDRCKLRLIRKPPVNILPPVTHIPIHTRIPIQTHTLTTMPS